MSLCFYLQNGHNFTLQHLLIYDTDLSIFHLEGAKYV